MKAKVFAFDPGQTTGYCVITVDDEGKSFGVVECGEIAWEERLEAVHSVLNEATSQSYIVIEVFRLFPHKALPQIGSEFPSVRLIGIIETMHYFGRMAQPIKYQTPGDIARVAVLDEHLTWVAGSPHKIDAYRHARLFFLQHFYMNPFQA